MKTQASKTPLKDLPKEFMGCMWDDGWEFDAPCVIYSPIHAYGFGGNIGHIDDMVERFCIDLAVARDEGKPEPSSELGPMERKEFKWRRWSVRGCALREKAWHVKIKVRWRMEDGETCFEQVSRMERFGTRGKWKRG